MKFTVIIKKRKMTKNSEIYGVRRDIESRTIIKTDSIVDSVIDEHIKRA